MYHDVKLPHACDTSTDAPIYAILYTSFHRLIYGMVPFWAKLRHVQWFKSALNGVNATAIGLVGAACVILWEGAVATAADAMVFILAGTLAMVYGWGAPWVVLAGGVFGAILHQDALNLGQVEWCTLTQQGGM